MRAETSPELPGGALPVCPLKMRALAISNAILGNKHKAGWMCKPDKGKAVPVSFTTAFHYQSWEACADGGEVTL